VIRHSCQTSEHRPCLSGMEVPEEGAKPFPLACVIQLSRISNLHSKAAEATPIDIA
jgi:hypothetical protein